METDMRIAAAQNYNLANLIRAAVWAKRMPSFETVNGKEETPERIPKRMTDDDMYAVVCRLNQALGGTVE